MRRRFEAATDETVPALFRGRAVLVLFAIEPAADDQPVAGAGHRDVEQPAVLLRLPVSDAPPFGFRHRVAKLAAWRPEENLAAVVAGHPQQVLLHLRGLAGIRQEDDRRLQPLGAVDR